MSGASDGDTTDSAMEGPTLEARRATRSDTVMVEGAMQRVQTRLVSSPEDFPLPFSTYVNDRMELESSSGDRPTTRLVWPFGDSREPGVIVTVYPEGMSVAQAVTQERQTHEERFSLQDREIAGGWSHTGFAFREEGTPAPEALQGWMGFASRHGRAFSITAQYYAEMADGLGPWTDHVLRRWRWEDTGDRLVQNGAG